MYPVKRIFLLAISCILCLVADAQPVHVLHTTYLQRYKYIDSLGMAIAAPEQSDKDKKIEALVKWAEKNNDEELARHIELMQYNNVDIDDEETTNKALKYIAELEKGGMVFLAIDGYELLARSAWNARKYSYAIEYGLKSYNLYKGFTLKEFPKRLDYQHSLAIKYYVFKDYTRAKQLLQDLKTAGTGDLYDIIHGSNYNTLALAYSKLGEYNEALTAFIKIYNNELRSKNYISAAIAAGNAGEVYYVLKDYDNAIKWLQEEYRIGMTYYPGHINSNIANSNILLAELYMHKGQPEQALISLNNAKALFANDASYTTLKNYYQQYARIMAAQNRMREAYIFLDSSQLYNDSARVEFDRSQLREAELKIDKINYELQLKDLRHNRETSVFIRNGAIIIILLLSVIALLFINRSRLRHKQKQAVLEKDKEKTQLELNSAAQQLEQFTKNIHEKNQLIDLFTNEIATLKNTDGDEEKNETLALLQQSTILTDEEWDKFRALFEKVHIGFLTRLKEKYSDITPAETRYLALTKLNLSNKEMANMLGTGTTAVRNYKYRLRKKLDLPDDDSFDDMIRNI